MRDVQVNRKVRPGRRLAARRRGPRGMGPVGTPPTVTEGPATRSLIAAILNLYVRPALRKMMGHDRLFRPTVTAFLTEDIRKKRGRRYFIRGIISRGEDGGLHARTTGEQGSGILRSMSRANGIIVLPEEADGAGAGDRVEVYLIDCEDALFPRED